MMFTRLFVAVSALCFTILVDALNTQPLCSFTAPSTCGLSEGIVQHLNLKYLAPNCTVDPVTAPGVDPHAGHDMGRRLHVVSTAMDGWQCDAARTALGCKDAKILHSMKHEGSDILMTHYMSVCMPGSIADDTTQAQSWWDAKMAYDSCTMDCAQTHANKIRVALSLENDVSTSTLDDAMNYINKAATACGAATTETACNDASHTIAMMYVPTVTSSSIAPISTLLVVLLSGLALLAC